jgi:peptide/nickel transport system ATP-binding protein
MRAGKIVARPGWETIQAVSALDVSVQARVLRLLEDLHREAQLSFLVITHDFAVVRDINHRVVVLDAGRIVETGDVDHVLDQSTNGRTRALLEDVLPLPFATAQANKRAVSGWTHNDT